jgi:hypothetical protein
MLRDIKETWGSGQLMITLFHFFFQIEHEVPRSAALCSGWTQKVECTMALSSVERQIDQTLALQTGSALMDESPRFGLTCNSAFWPDMCIRPREILTSEVHHSSYLFNHVKDIIRVTLIEVGADRVPPGTGTLIM